MPTFTANDTAVSAKASELYTSAFREIGIGAPGEALSAEDAAWGLEKLQRLIDRINAREQMIYNVNFALFTLPTNQQPITIGPGGTFDVAQRPVKIASASLVLTSSPTAVDVPLGVRDNAWWRAQRVKGLTSTLPTDIYYSPDTPLGNLYPWPIPTQGNDIRLEMWVNLTQAINGNTLLALPPAYWDYLVLQLATDLAPSYAEEAVQAAANLAPQLREAKKIIQGNNITSPRMSTAEAGQTSRKGRAPDFNYYTGGRA